MIKQRACRYAKIAFVKQNDKRKGSLIIAIMMCLFLGSKRLVNSMSGFLHREKRNSGVLAKTRENRIRQERIS